MKIVVLIVLFVAANAMAQSGQFIQVPGRNCEAIIDGRSNLNSNQHELQAQIAEISKDKFRVTLTLNFKIVDLAPLSFFLCDEKGVSGSQTFVACPAVQMDTVRNLLKVSRSRLGQEGQIFGTFKLKNCQSGARVPMELLK